MEKRPVWLQKKLVEPALLDQKVAQIRASGRTIATLNGSFDLFHAGHLFIIHEAAQQADALIVALNSDASIQKYKSPLRPIVSLAHRLEMMAAIEWVDYVTWFEETDPRSLLARICPDVHVNGAEYGEQCVEADVVKQHGGRLHLVRRIPGLATSALIEKIRQCG